MYEPTTNQRRIPPGRRGAGRVMTDEEVGFEAARARNEAAKADMNEMKAQEMAGELLPRRVWQDASATVFAMLAQSLRGLSDNLERSAGLTAEQAASVDSVVNETLAEIAKQFKALARDDG